MKGGSRAITMADVKTAPAGLATLGLGDPVIVKQDDGSWKQGYIVDVVDLYTVLYEDGKHATLENREFTIQRMSRLADVSAGTEVLVAADEGSVSDRTRVQAAFPPRYHLTLHPCPVLYSSTTIVAS